jgi:hypothetical protein
MEMKKIPLFAVPFALLALSACGSPEIGAATSEIKSAAKSVAGEAIAEAGLAPGGLLTTQNACLLAGQSDVFCGCLATELGNKLDADHVAGLAPAIKASLEGDLGAAAKEAATINPQTRTALAKCGTRAAIAGAVGQ